MQKDCKKPYGNIEGILTLQNDPLIKSYIAGTLPTKEVKVPKKKKKGSR